MSVKSDLTKGFLSGFIATLPMTIIMLIIKAFLPFHQREELPPEKITQTVMEKLTHQRKPLNKSKKQKASLLAHFVFGGLGGAIYAILLRRAPGPPLLKGSLFALLLWATSYQGWLPAANLHPPASREDKGRNLLMVFAHLIWGYTVAKLA